MSVQVEKGWEIMSKDKVRAARNFLGREKIENSHVECICKRGGIKFHGKIHLVDGDYYLESKSISLVKEAMKKESRTRSVTDEIPCVWNIPKEQPQKEQQRRTENSPKLRVLPKPEGDSNYAVA